MCDLYFYQIFDSWHILLSFISHVTYIFNNCLRLSLYLNIYLACILCDDYFRLLIHWEMGVTMLQICLAVVRPRRWRWQQSFSWRLVYALQSESSEHCAPRSPVAVGEWRPMLALTWTCRWGCSGLRTQYFSPFLPSATHRLPDEQPEWLIQGCISFSLTQKPGISGFSPSSTSASSSSTSSKAAHTKPLQHWPVLKHFPPLSSQNPKLRRASCQYWSSYGQADTATKHTHRTVTAVTHWVYMVKISKFRKQKACYSFIWNADAVFPLICWLLCHNFSFWRLGV